MKTLKFLLMAGFVLGLELGSALGQEAPETCTQCICVADGSCSSESGCSSGDQTGCASTTFTASCGGMYTLRYGYSCGGGECAHCYACVYLKDASGNVLGVAHSSCASGDCTANGDTPTLTAGNSYTLFVCKRSCGDSCGKCPAECIARGYAFIGGSYETVCSAIPPCNP